MSTLGFGFGDPLLEEMERSIDRAMNRAFGNFFPQGFNAPLLEAPRPETGRQLAHKKAPRETALTMPEMGLALPTVHMPMDIVETEKAYELHADAPGMVPENVKVELNEGVLSISGDRSVARDEKDKEGKLWRSERSSYSFARSFTLPDNVDADGIHASMDKGVLVVTLPKKEVVEPKVQPKRIKVAGNKAPEAAKPVEKK